MNLNFSRSSKVMVALVGLSIAWLLCSGFDVNCTNPCDDDEVKALNTPLEKAFWVACVDNKPTLMTWNEGPFGSTGYAQQVSNTATGDFNPSDYDCTRPNSPPSKNTAAAPYTPGPSNARPSARAASGTVAYLPPVLRDLPFTPAVPLTTQPCDSTFADVYQIVHTQGKLTRISTCPFQVKKTIPVVSRPLQVAITPDGTTALVTSYDGAVTFIDTATDTITFTLATDVTVSPSGIAISPDGTRAYITSFDTDNPVVQVIDLSLRKVIATFQTTLQYPQGATLTPDGSQLWITGPLDSVMDIYDTATNTLITRLNLGLTTDIAFNAKGTRAYITTQTNIPGNVAVVDTATFQTLSSFKVGVAPTDIAFAPGDRYLIVNNSLDGSISTIDTKMGGSDDT